MSPTGSPILDWGFWILDWSYSLDFDLTLN